MANDNLIPAGTYVGKGVSGSLKPITSDTKKTPGYEGLVEITQEGPWKGSQYVWHGWNSEGAAVRTMDQLMIAGCTFPGDDTTNLTGWGTATGLGLVIGVEPATTIKDKEGKDKPIAERRRCEFINEGLGGRGVTAIDKNDAAAKAAFQASAAGALPNGRRAHRSVAPGRSRGAGWLPG